MMRGLRQVLNHAAVKTMVATAIVGIGLKMLAEVRDEFHEQITEARETLQSLNVAVMLARQNYQAWQTDGPDIDPRSAAAFADFPPAEDLPPNGANGAHPLVEFADES